MILVVAEEEPAFENFHLNLLCEKILSATGMERINSHCWEEEGDSNNLRRENHQNFSRSCGPFGYKVAKTGRSLKILPFCCQFDDQATRLSMWLSENEIQLCSVIVDTVGTIHPITLKVSFNNILMIF